MPPSPRAHVQGRVLQEAEYRAEVAIIVVAAVALHPQQAFPDKVNGPPHLPSRCAMKSDNQQSN